MASGCIAKYTRTLCGETVELEGRQHIISSPPHLTWHPKRTLGKEQFCPEEHRKRVRGSAGIPSHDDQHKLHGSVNTWQECVRPRAGKDSF